MSKNWTSVFFILGTLIVNLSAEDILFTLDGMVAEAIRNNPTVLSKQNSVKSSQYQQDSSFWQYFPTPIASYSRQKGGIGTSMLGLQQPLFAGGKIDAEYAKSKLQVQINAMSTGEVKQSIALSVANSYYTFLASYGKTLIFQDEIKRLQKQKEMISRRIEQDVSPQSDLILVESRLAQTKTDLSIAIASQEKMLSQLSQFIAKKISIDDINKNLPKKSCSLVIIEFYDNQQFIERSIEKSPTLSKLDYQIKIAQEDINIKKSSFYPNIVARLEKNLANGGVNETAGTVAIEFNTGAGLSSMSNYQSAKINAMGAEYDKQAYVLEYTQILESELNDYVLTRDRYENYVAAAQGAEKTLHSYERLFVAGKKSWLEVLNSEKEWTNTLLSLNDTQAYLYVMPIKLKIYANEMEWQKGNR